MIPVRLAALAVAVLSACTPAASPREPAPAAPSTTAAAPAAACDTSWATTLPSELMPSRSAYIAAWEGTDAAAVLRFFTDDARVTLDDQSLAGTAAIREHWVGEDIGKLSDIEMTPRTAARSGDEITESGTMTLRFRHAGGETTREIGAFTHVWVRQPDDTWRLREVRLHRGAAC